MDIPGMYWSLTTTGICVGHAGKPSSADQQFGIYDIGNVPISSGQCEIISDCSTQCSEDFHVKHSKYSARHVREVHSRGMHKKNEAHSRYEPHAERTLPLDVGSSNVAPSAKNRNAYKDLPKIRHRFRIEYSTSPPRRYTRSLQDAKLSTCRSMARVFQTADSLVELQWRVSDSTRTQRHTTV